MLFRHTQDPMSRFTSNKCHEAWKPYSVRSGKNAQYPAVSILEKRTGSLFLDLMHWSLSCGRGADIEDLADFRHAVDRYLFVVLVW